MHPAAPSVVIVATGVDSHMRSATPRPLHPVCGRALVGHVVGAVTALEPRRLAVALGPRDDEVAKELASASIEVSRVSANVRHDPCAAVLAALGGWADDDLDLDLDPDDDDVLVMSASTPLVEGETLRAFHRAHRQGDAAATALVGSDGSVDRDHSPVWFVRRSLLAPALRRTEWPSISAIGGVLAQTGHDIAELAVDSADLLEIRDRADLAIAEERMRRRINERWMRAGVTMRDPRSAYVDVSVELEPDVTLAAGVVLAGSTAIGAGTEVGPGCHLVDTTVGERCRLESTTAKLATIGDHARVGPHAVLDPGSEIAAATVTGPFYTAGPDAP